MLLGGFISSTTDGGFCHQGHYPKHLRLLQHTDMTIHSKALEEHLLMVPLLF
jgi:hypothetical protein